MPNLSSTHLHIPRSRMHFVYELPHYLMPHSHTHCIHSRTPKSLFYLPFLSTTTMLLHTYTTPKSQTPTQSSRSPNCNVYVRVTTITDTPALSALSNGVVSFVVRLHGVQPIPLSYMQENRPFDSSTDALFPLT